MKRGRNNNKKRKGFLFVIILIALILVVLFSFVGLIRIIFGELTDYIFQILLIIALLIFLIKLIRDKKISNIIGMGADAGVMYKTKFTSSKNPFWYWFIIIIYIIIIIVLIMRLIYL